jgi:hypothetical protein
MLSCRHATRLVSDELDRSLSWTERLCLGVHLFGCPPCQRFRRAARWVHRAVAVATSEGDVRLPDDARERIQGALERAADE